MQFIYHLLLFTIYFLILVHCKGGRGGGRGGSVRGFVGRGARRSNSAKRENVIDPHFGILFIAGFLEVIMVFLYYMYCKQCKDPVRQENRNFVFATNENIERQGLSNVNCLQSGIYSSQYYQHGKWHGPYQLPLIFDSQSMNVTGSGADDVGTFTIKGIYSNATNRIALTKTYISGTGSPSENFGHKVTIQLTWNVKTNQFDGAWYIETSQYNSDGKFILKAVEHQSPSAILNV